MTISSIRRWTFLADVGMSFIRDLIVSLFGKLSKRASEQPRKASLINVHCHCSQYHALSFIHMSAWRQCAWSRHTLWSEICVQPNRPMATLTQKFFFFLHKNFFKVKILLFVFPLFWFSSSSSELLDCSSSVIDASRWLTLFSFCASAFAVSERHWKAWSKVKSASSSDTSCGVFVFFLGFPRICQSKCWCCFWWAWTLAFQEGQMSAMLSGSTPAHLGMSHRWYWQRPALCFHMDFHWYTGTQIDRTTWTHGCSVEDGHTQKPP